MFIRHNITYALPMYIDRIAVILISLIIVRLKYLSVNIQLFFLNFVYTGVNLKVISGDPYAGGLSVYIMLKSRKSINIDDTYKAIH